MKFSIIVLFSFALDGCFTLRSIVLYDASCSHSLNECVSFAVKGIGLPKLRSRFSESVVLTAVVFAIF